MMRLEFKFGDLDDSIVLSGWDSFKELILCKFISWDDVIGLGFDFADCLLFGVIYGLLLLE